MIEALTAVILGTLLGVFTGLIPGIHPNTVVFASLPFYFSSGLEFEVYMALIAGMGVSHSIHSFIPAFFLTAPEGESLLASIPGVEMASNGKGREAFALTVGGGLAAALAFVLAAPVLALVLPVVYPFLDSVMFFVLAFFLFYIIADAKSPFNALAVALLSGLLGLSVLNSGIEAKFILLPIFGGLFAAPSLIYTALKRRELGEQEEGFEASIKPEDGAAGLSAGLLAGVVPGIGPAVSTSFVSPVMERSRKRFVASLGGVNTADILASFIALYLIGKPRTGSTVALQSIQSVRWPHILFLIGASMFATGLASVIAFRSADLFLEMRQKINVNVLVGAGLSSVLGVTWVFTGFYGLLVLFTASAIGSLSLITEERAAAMTVLIVPAMSFFIQGFI